MAQCERVALAEALDVARLEADTLGNAEARLERQQLTVGEDVGIDEGGLLACQTTRSGARCDAVVEQDTVVGQQPVEFAEVCFELVCADVLEHPNRGYGIELTGDIAVILDLDGNSIAQPFLADPELRLGRLFRAQSHADGLDAVVLRGVAHQRPPAAPNVEEALPPLELQLAADQIELALLGIGQRLLRIEEVGARVHHFRVEKQFEEIVAGVVVMADGLAVAARRVEAAPNCGTGGILAPAVGRETS